MLEVFLRKVTIRCELLQYQAKAVQKPARPWHPCHYPRPGFPTFNQRSALKCATSDIGRDAAEIIAYHRTQREYLWLPLRLGDNKNAARRALGQRHGLRFHKEPFGATFFTKVECGEPVLPGSGAVTLRPSFARLSAPKQGEYLSA